MICDNIAHSLGFSCSVINDDGTVAYVSTPFKFADGDPVPVYMQVVGQRIRFFDDGEVLLHFKGRGLSLLDRRQVRFVVRSAERHGTTYSDEWVLEAIGNTAEAQDVFRRYMSALLDICTWEIENEGTDEDAELLVEEAVMAIRAAKPSAQIERDPPFKGVSGKQRTLSLLIDGVGVAVTGTHHASVSSALMNMVDIRQAGENQGRRFMFLIVDKLNPEKARQDAAVLQAAADVQLLSNLERMAPASEAAH